jgi:hypothetical protein
MMATAFARPSEGRVKLFARTGLGWAKAGKLGRSTGAKSLGDVAGGTP